MTESDLKEYIGALVNEIQLLYVLSIAIIT